MSTRPSKFNGFSLCECLISVALLAGLCALALPSFATLVQRQISTSTRDDFFAVIQHARAESLSRQQHVVLCATRDQQTCDLSQDWRSGAMSFIDSNKNRRRDASERILHIVSIPNELRVRASRSLLVYRADGSARGSNLSVALCHTRIAGMRGDQVVVANSGRARMDRAECR
jgi:type IV fimbrial biogenesis protein FimT